MSVREDADILLARLSKYEDLNPRYKREHVPLDVLRDHIFEGMDPTNVNDAVSVLEDDGFVGVTRVFGTAPFDFGDLLLTARGKSEAEHRLSEKSPASTIVLQESPEAPRARLGEWQVLRRLDGGAQADVFLVRSMKKRLDSAQRRAALEQAISVLAAQVGDSQQRDDAVARLLSVVADVVEENSADVAVLKKLRNPNKKRKARLANEVRALRKLRHHAIVRLLDADTDAGWFTMSYCEGGTLTSRLNNWTNDVSGALQAIRPVVEAIAEIHQLNLVHRDIKPDNIFCNTDGKLVLGDFGLVIDADSDEPRMTAHEERVGSEDWMPLWARFGRLDEVKATFDAYCLGKVIWAMLTGRSRLPMRYDYDPTFVLPKKADDESASHWAEQVLKRVVVDREAEMQIQNGTQMLKAIDDILGRLRVGAQRFSATRTCRVCGTGVYVETPSVPWTQLAVSEPGGRDRMKFYRCSDCGHVQHFFFNDQKAPTAWSE
jgi:serine/threonine protein kinase